MSPSKNDLNPHTGRRLWRPVLFLLLLLFLAACQGDGGEATTPAAEPTTEAVGETVAPATPTIEATTASTEEAPAGETPAAPTAVSTATTAPAASATPIAEEVRFPLESISLEPVATGFFHPTFLTHAFDERLFVSEQHGLISIVQDGQRLETPFLDITDRVSDQASEQGLLSVVFHPDYAENGWFFVNYTDLNGDTVVSRFEVTGDPNVADPGSEFVLLNIDQPYGNHNGGQLQFGPDGYLYIGMGDGGSANDPDDNGQDPTALLGSLLRIDVNSTGNGTNYAIPADNPFANDQPGWRPEIWAIGLRNPWRFSFDREMGDLYLADVGQNQYEEVNFNPAGSTRGLNYGWPIMEATHCFRQENCSPAGLVIPVAEYDHGFGCSITGGYVYRGEQHVELRLHYFFADYCSGIIWAIPAGSTNVEAVIVAESGLVISSFGEDSAGELYVLDHSEGTVYQIQP